MDRFAERIDHRRPSPNKAILKIFGEEQAAAGL